jgi:hypothetical protein
MRTRLIVRFALGMRRDGITDEVSVSFDATLLFVGLAILVCVL